MVGGRRLQINQEPNSLNLAPNLVREVWAVARQLRAGSFHDADAIALAEMKKATSASYQLIVVSSDERAKMDAAITAMHNSAMGGRTLTVNEARPRENNRSGGGVGGTDLLSRESSGNHQQIKVFPAQYGQDCWGQHRTLCGVHDGLRSRM